MHELAAVEFRVSCGILPASQISEKGCKSNGRHFHTVRFTGFSFSFSVPHSIRLITSPNQRRGLQTTTNSGLLTYPRSSGGGRTSSLVDETQEKVPLTTAKVAGHDGGVKLST
ncbi:putative (2R)-phospho-3-sulfolactate synthase (ComA) [Anopheles sinensis]|uniref:Putative (2R)-phospho-3-sulfolactate synthase (ComA) n=1 Tax=Anopheles sinensis TaxID=74873 RepID=A0A084WBZ0_ANOSI|nr:putative (2R)-phospho-3-sulfolactate synthase (ComA) [Anopheles sinensis]